LKNQTAFVVGAGIAGLTVAIALKLQGIQVKVIEKYHNNQPSGAGIQITPNAYNILEKIGVADLLQPIATFPKAIQINHYLKASCLFNFNLHRHYQQQYMVVLRRDFIHVLLERCRQLHIGIEYGVNIDRYQTDNNRIVLYANNRSLLSSEYVVIADGVHSNYRSQIANTADFSGYVAYRALIYHVPKHLRNPNIIVWIANKQHIVVYPINKHCSTVNIVAVTQDKKYNFDRKQPISSRELCQLFSQFHPQLQQLLQLGQTYSPYPIYQHPNTIWGMQNAKGRVQPIIIGDAAHAMLPFIAQGGNMAIEDAFFVAKSVANNDAATTTVQKLQKYRNGRIAKVKMLSALNAKIYHLTDKKLVYLRLLQLKIANTLPWLFTLKMHWLFAYKLPKKISEKLR